MNDRSRDYSELRETHRQVADAQAQALNDIDARKVDAVKEIDAHEAAMAKRTAELQDKVADRKIDAREAVYQERRFDNELVVAQNGREMSDARAARLARLQGIDRQVENEQRPNEGQGLDPTRPDDRSR